MLAVIAVEEAGMNPWTSYNPSAHLYFGHGRFHFQIECFFQEACVFMVDRTERITLWLLLYQDSGGVHS